MDSEQKKAGQNNLFATKKRLIIFTILYLLGGILTFAAVSDLYTENPFQRNYIMAIGLVAINTFVIGYAWYKYYKYKKAVQNL